MLYVGITRARERLLLTHVRYRYIFGTMTDQRTSRFMHELPDWITSADCSQWAVSDIHTYLRDWYAERPVTIKKAVVEKPKLIIPDFVFDDEPQEERVQKLRINQRVRHATFGIGTIKQLEDRGDDALFATVQFGTKTKKISTDFLVEL